MSSPSRPVFLKEGPASACVINGHALGWTNCGCLAAAMGIDKSSLGTKRLSGCQVRRETHDTSGGTTIEQNAAVARAHGIAVEVRTGSGVCSPSYAATKVQAGRGFMLSGNTSALIRTAFRCTERGVNHTVWVNEVRGGTLGHPKEAFVYDAAAEGRVRPWGRADQGPSWWPWSVVLAFAAALRPWGDGDARLLGPGKFYCGIFPDTEPHAHIKYSAVKTVPCPDKQVIKSPVAGARVNVRKGPSKAYAVVGTLPTGAAFTAYQVKKNGGLDRGTKVWYGSHDGTKWVHESGLAGKGGAS